MPATFPAHQGLILGAKLRWPRHVDATALCIGAAAPDLAYPLGGWLKGESHTAVGLVVWAIPIGVVLAIVLRRWAAPGLFTCLPDMGPLKLHSYAVLHRRRPAMASTVTSVTVGAASHVLFDGFTHAGRWGANWLGLNGTAFTAPVRGTMSWARVLQYFGHVGGTVLFVVFLAIIASSGRISCWYGENAVAKARSHVATRGQRAIFMTIAVVPPATAVVAVPTTGADSLFLAQTVGVVSLLIAGVVSTRLQTRRSNRVPIG